MREILFRAKAINRDRGYHRTDYKNGDWVYGIITKLYDERFENLPAEMRDVDGVNGIDVDYKTVGQYTGLTDKNGKKIFEGDIVTTDYYLKKDKTKNSIIEYGEWNCSCCNGVFGWVSNGFVDFRDYDVIVIGNIHDNPELLKGDNNE